MVGAGLVIPGGTCNLDGQPIYRTSTAYLLRSYRFRGAILISGRSHDRTLERRVTTANLWPGVGPVTPLAPGLWLSQDGNLHVAVGELLPHLGAPDTPENRALVRKHLQQQWASGLRIPLPVGTDA